MKTGGSQNVVASSGRGELWHHLHGASLGGGALLGAGEVLPGRRRNAKRDTSHPGAVAKRGWRDITTRFLLMFLD